MTTPAQIVLTELSSDPTGLPPSGTLGLYAKSGSEGFYSINSSGTVVGPFGSGGGGGTPGGSNTQVQYNNSGVFGADAGFTFTNSGTSGTSALTVNNGTGTSEVILGNIYFGGLSLYYNGFNGALSFNSPQFYIQSFGTGLELIAVDSTLGQLSLMQPGAGLSIAEGTNAKSGLATLAAGTVTVSNSSVTSNSRFILTVQSLGTVTIPTMVAITSQSPGTGFTITSADPTDTSVIYYQIVEAI